MQTTLAKPLINDTLHSTLLPYLGHMSNGYIMYLRYCPLSSTFDIYSKTIPSTKVTLKMLSLHQCFSTARPRTGAGPQIYFTGPRHIDTFNDIYFVCFDHFQY